MQTPLDVNKIKDDIFNLPKSASQHARAQLFYGNSNKELAKEVCSWLGKIQEKETPDIGKIRLRKFADGEFWCKIEETVRERDVYILQSTSSPVNDNLMELFIIVDALRRASAKKITAIIPYFGYARQDRKTQGRVPITAALVSNLLQASGVDRVVAIDLHCGQIQGFFSNRIPVDNISAKSVLIDGFIKNIKDLNTKNLCVVSPDAGGAERVDSYRKELSEKLGVSVKMAMMNKHRDNPNEVSTMELIGVKKIKGADCIIHDDIADTCGTLTKAAECLLENGAKRVFAAISHGLFNGNAIEKLNKSKIEKVIVSNSVPLKKKCDKIIVASVAEIVAKAIIQIKQKKSISVMFETYKEINKKLPLNLNGNASLCID